MRGDQFQVRTIGKADQGHLRDAIAVHTAIDALQADSLEIGAHSAQVKARYRDMVDNHGVAVSTCLARGAGSGVRRDATQATTRYPSRIATSEPYSRGWRLSDFTSHK